VTILSSAIKKPVPEETGFLGLAEIPDLDGHHTWFRLGDDLEGAKSFRRNAERK
jgi:hypothetical protein